MLQPIVHKNNEYAVKIVIFMQYWINKVGYKLKKVYSYRYSDYRHHANPKLSTLASKLG